jgi:ribosome maturation factor RimP
VDPARCAADRRTDPHDPNRTPEDTLVNSARQDATRERIEEALTGPLAALGYDVEAVEVSPAGKRRVLRVAVDKDGGVTLDDVAEATREVDRVLEESDVMGEQPYTLEVTSRGVDRPLSLPRHWRRNTDRLVKVTGTDGTTTTGRVLEASEESAVLDVDGTRTEVAYAEVAKALVQVEFNRRGAPEPDEAHETHETEQDDEDGEDA